MNLISGLTINLVMQLNQPKANEYCNNFTGELLKIEGLDHFMEAINNEKIVTGSKCFFVEFD